MQEGRTSSGTRTWLCKKKYVCRKELKRSEPVIPCKLALQACFPPAQLPRKHVGGVLSWLMVSLLRHLLMYVSVPMCSALSTYSRSLAKHCTTWNYHLWGRYPRSLCDFQVLLPPNSDPSGTLFSKPKVCSPNEVPRRS
jgi:hypothetical protein